MQEAGMPLIECIKAATLSAADLLGASDIIGSIETGKFADIVAVEGDPFSNVLQMGKIAFVMKEGVQYK